MVAGKRLFVKAALHGATCNVDISRNLSPPQRLRGFHGGVIGVFVDRLFNFRLQSLCSADAAHAEKPSMKNENQESLRRRESRNNVARKIE